MSKEEKSVTAKAFKSLEELHKYVKSKRDIVKTNEKMKTKVLKQTPKNKKEEK